MASSCVKQFFRFRLPLLVAILLLGITRSISAQTAPPPAYEFLTVTTFESQIKVLARIVIAPAFAGKSEIQLEDFGGFSAAKNLDKLQRNTLLINQQLSDITSAGWELAHVYPVAETGVLITRYLFRKVKS
jgi:hypothetical protein